MQKYLTQTSEELAVIQWMTAFGLSDVYDALEEVSRKVTNPVPLLLIDHSTEFDPSLDELERMVSLFEKYKKRFTNRVAYVVSKDVHYGLGHMLHILFSVTGIVFVPFRDLGDAREWLNEIPP